MFGTDTPTWQLVDEMVTDPLSCGLGTLALSGLIAKAGFGVLDWQVVAMPAIVDVLIVALDHYRDHSTEKARAQRTGQTTITRVFGLAQIFLLAILFLFLVSLSTSDMATVLSHGIYAVPGLLWDVPIFPPKASGADGKPNKPMTVKRIPGMKALLVGTIRTMGSYAIVRNALRDQTSEPEGPWTMGQILIWSIIHYACQCVMEDIRDVAFDTKENIKTIPVLLRSVFRAKLVLWTIHALTALTFRHNPYIVAAEAFTSVLVWAFDENTSRPWFRLSFHAQTISVLVYAINQAQ